MSTIPQLARYGIKVKRPNHVRRCTTKQLNGRWSWDAFVFFQPLAKCVRGTTPLQFCDLRATALKSFRTRRAALADLDRVVKSLHLP